MQFSSIILAVTLAATVSAKTCGINGALCPGKRSVGMTNQVREWISARAPVAAIEADKN